MTRGDGATSVEFDLTKTSGDATPPYGRLFPLLAVETQLSGFKFLVFRDPWGKNDTIKSYKAWQG